MHGQGEAHAAQVIFGWDPLWFAGILFVITYALIMSEKINRAIVATSAAAIMVLAGVITEQKAVHGVDFNTIGLLTGMMIIVAITRRSGVFQYLAVWAAKKVDARPWGILVMLVVVTALLSALLDNVTTVLLIAPVTLLITEALGVKAYPYLFAEILASNIGGSATLIGDPPNIMIGSAVGLSFNDFIVHLAPAAVIVMLATMVPIYLIWGRHLKASDESRQRVMNYKERDAISDPVLLVKSLSVLALVILGFALAHFIGKQPSTIALSGAALLLLLDNLGRKSSKQTEQVHATFCEVEWVTIFFFIGLFVVVHGLESTGLLTMLAEEILNLTGGDMSVTAMAILWGSAIASAVVDNIPFVATTIPLIKSMAPTFGGAEALMPLWWSLALGACLGGNGSLVGASANLIVAGFAERARQPIGFMAFTLAAFPLMLFSILISSVYIYLRYL
ncbi:MAG: ArsB/NhaD family transporter [Chromatiales bacterium]|nr:ArsB/NhaD family transporter [Chromatiales bacterium]